MSASAVFQTLAQFTLSHNGGLHHYHRKASFFYCKSVAHLL